MQALIIHTQLSLLVSEIYFDPTKIVSLKLGPLSVAAILFSSHPYIVRLLLQPYNVHGQLEHELNPLYMNVLIHMHIMLNPY